MTEIDLLFDTKDTLGTHFLQKKSSFTDKYKTFLMFDNLYIFFFCSFDQKSNFQIVTTDGRNFLKQDFVNEFIDVYNILIQWCHDVCCAL